MIGKLRGIIDHIGEDHALLDVGGVGYLVFCSPRTLAALPPEGEAAQLIIETHVREDHIHLYGFPDAVERDWFRLLSSVQRVGNKMALAILGVHAPAQLAQAILAKDTAAFSRIGGVGPKLAERIVTELKDKVNKLPTSPFQKTQKPSPNPQSLIPNPSLTDDAVSALVNLGYSRSEAYGAAARASRNAAAEARLDELIKLSLKELVRA